MNKAILIGRLTKRPELKSTMSGVSVATFTVAVNRRFKNADGNYDADFINCVAWRQQAEFLCKFFEKGSQIGVVGSIQTRNYEGTDGKTVYVTEVACDEIHFVGAKKESQSEMPTLPDNFGFVPMPGEELPY